MVCTNDTAIFPVAIELAICPPTWNTDNGTVVINTNRLGFLNPPASPGIARPSTGTNRATNARTRHQPATNANCSIATVTGQGKAFRMLFVDVFDSAEDRYHIKHSSYFSMNQLPAPRSLNLREKHTISFQLMGAFTNSTTSPALMLCARFRPSLSTSEMLFALPCAMGLRFAGGA